MSLGSGLRDLFNDRSNFNIIGHTRRWLAASGILVAICIATLALRGLNLNIDFEGGTSWQVKVSGKSVSTKAVRDLAQNEGVDNPTVTILGGNTVLLQSRTVDSAKSEKVTQALLKYAGITDRNEVSVSEIGPTWGDEISSKALRALIFFFIAIVIYLTFRFELKMALAALVALAHDLVLTIGVYAITQLEVSPATVVAVLTILGFSLYDTAIVFDKIKENVDSVGSSGRVTYGSTVNRSLNDVMLRSLNTSLSALIPVIALLVVGSGILGALVLRDFSLALFIGLLSGTYSSIFVASPVLVWWKEREQRWSRVKERLAAKPGSELNLSLAAATPGGLAGLVAEAEASEGEAPDAVAKGPVKRPRPSSGSARPAGRPTQVRRKRKK